MSALDKIRSFAEARCADDEVIRDGLTYGDAREILAEIERLSELLGESDRASVLDDRPPQEGTDEYDELSAHKQAESDQWWYEWERRERPLLCCAPPGQPTLIQRESSAATPRGSSAVTHWERK